MLFLLAKTWFGGSFSRCRTEVNSETPVVIRSTNKTATNRRLELKIQEWKSKTRIQERGISRGRDLIRWILGNGKTASSAPTP